MNKFIVIVLVIFLSTTVFAESLPRSSEAKQGKDLHLKILTRNPKIDKFYQQPDLSGALTPAPKVSISLPMAAWEKLTPAEKNLLAAYAASLVESARRDPLGYARVPDYAPAASAIKRNALKMTDKSWQIVAGKVTNDGRGILSDSVVLFGN